jgi:hypothetical protein
VSERAVTQVKALITADLSMAEKAQLIEWLGGELRQELARQSPESVAPEYDGTHRNEINGFTKTAQLLPQDEIPWEEQPWTAEELHELMCPDPKTGAEIAAMIESGEVDTSVWAAMDIPDVVEWINEQRHQRMQRRTEQWVELS